MGACTSVDQEAELAIQRCLRNLTKDDKRDFAKLGFTNDDITKLYRIFYAMDYDNSEVIKLSELLAFVDVAETKISKRIFRSINGYSGSGKINFYDFIVTIWNFCTLSQQTLASFAFDLYDLDSSGVIDKNELKNMLHDVYGQTYENSAHAKVLCGKIGDVEHAKVDLVFFLSFAKMYPALLYPVSVLQIKMRNVIGGEEFWGLLEQTREKLCNHKYVSVEEFLIIPNIKKELNRELDQSAKNLEGTARTGGESERNNGSRRLSTGSIRSMPREPERSSRRQSFDFNGASFGDAGSPTGSGNVMNSARSSNYSEYSEQQNSSRRYAGDNDRPSVRRRTLDDNNSFGRHSPVHPTSRDNSPRHTARNMGEENMSARSKSNFASPLVTSCRVTMDDEVASQARSERSVRSVRTSCRLHLYDNEDPNSARERSVRYSSRRADDANTHTQESFDAQAENAYKTLDNSMTLSTKQKDPSKNPRNNDVNQQITHVQNKSNAASKKYSNVNESVKSITRGLSMENLLRGIGKSRKHNSITSTQVRVHPMS